MDIDAASYEEYYEGPFGRIRRCPGLTKLESAHLTAAVLVIVFNLVIDFDLLMRSRATDDEDFTYALLIAINTCFVCVYIFAGIYMEKKVYMVISIFSFLALLTYCSISYALRAEDGGPSLDVRRVRLTLMTITFLPFLISTGFIMNRFEWFGNNIIEVDRTNYRNMGRAYYSEIKVYGRLTHFTCLLIVDLQTLISLLVLVLAHGSYMDGYEKKTLVVGLPAACLWILVGYIVARRESKPLMIAFEVGGLTFICYVIWKIVNLVTNRCSSAGVESPTTPFYCSTTEEFWIANIVSVSVFGLVHSCTLLAGIFVYRGFKKNLRLYLWRNDRTILDRACDCLCCSRWEIESSSEVQPILTNNSGTQRCCGG